MMTTQTLLNKVTQAGWAVAAVIASPIAWAVKDLPGGPAVNQIDLHPPVTQIAADERGLHYFMLVICMVIFLGVFGVMFYSIVKHRKSKGRRPPTSTKVRRSRSSGPWCLSSSSLQWPCRPPRSWSR